MPKRAKELAAIEVKRDLTEPGLWAVGTVPGLHLQVATSGARSWVLRAVIGGKRRDMGLGGYPGVTLAGALEKARAARLLIADGIDPIEQRKLNQHALRAERGRMFTFEQVAKSYIASHAAGWKNAKHGQQWSSTLATYVHPVIGSLMVGDVALPHVMTILEPIWQTKTETASRVRSRIELVLDYAAARGYRTGDNPARWRGHLDKLLPRPSKVVKIEHFAAVPVSEAGAFMERLRRMPGSAARALEFLILTATRTGEVRGACWSEIDLDAASWTIPATRMKAEREHRVPLSPEAIELLRALPNVNDGNAAVFRSPRGGELSGMALLALMRRMKVDAVPHGFRSTFRDWAGERTAYPHEVCEMALAHTIPNKAEAAYRRGDLFDKRRQLMRDWARFLSTPEKVGSGAVTPIRRGRKV